MSRFVREYQEQFGENTTHIFNEARRLNEWRNLIDMTEEEILQSEIPEGQNFVTIRCRFNGRPSIVRVVRNRGEISYDVDFSRPDYEILERLDSLALLLGRIQLNL